MQVMNPLVHDNSLCQAMFMEGSDTACDICPLFPEKICSYYRNLDYLVYKADDLAQDGNNAGVYACLKAGVVKLRKIVNEYPAVDYFAVKLG